MKFPTEPLNDVGVLLNWEFYLYGGGARVFYLKERGRVVPPRDLDLVVLGSPNLAEVLKPFKPAKNKFGGYKFTHKDIAFDVWRWEDTAGIQGNTLADLYATTFFNIEQVTIKLPEAKLDFSEDFDQAFKMKVLEHTGFPTPSPKFQAVRAAVFADRFKLKLGPKLKAWVKENCPNLRAEEASRIQCMAYGDRSLSTDYRQRVMSGGQILRTLCLTP